MPELRPKQIEQLAYYIANPKCMDLSEPSTGKTPPVCVYSYFMWRRWENKTIWTMPKSIMRKNHDEMLRFTDFGPKDVVILRTDRANMTADWTGPTIQSFRTKRGWKVKHNGKETTTIALREELGTPTKFYYRHNGFIKPIESMAKVLSEIPKNGLEVEPILGPDGEPEKVSEQHPEVFKDLIEANKDAKVFISTFAFMSTHWERVLKAAPEIDLFLIDEIHMPGGYSTPGSKATDSFFWINTHVSRMVAMTGTLINGRLDSAYPVIQAIEPRYYGSLQGFMYEHAAVVDDYGRVTVWKNEDKLRKIIEKHSIKRTFFEVYGKEPVVFFTEYADMHEDVRKHYDKFHDQAVLELEDGRILDGSMAGVAITRARQIMAHPETMFKDTPEWTDKDERVEIHLREGKKTLIYAALKPEQERLLKLARSLGLRAELINSDTSGAKRERIDAMAQRGELDVIVASGPTAAVGWNWEMFDLVLFVSVDFMDTNVLQGYRRASRGGRTTTLRVVFLRYRNSIDDKQYDILTKKSELANRVDPDRPVLSFTE